MENETINESDIANQATALITQDFQAVVLEKLSKEVEAIKLSDWQDEETYKIAKKKKTEIKVLFDKLDRRRKDVKTVIENSAQIVLGEVSSLMDKLAEQMAIRTDEIARQKKEIQDKVDAQNAERRQKLLAVNAPIAMLNYEVLNDENFELLLQRETEAAQMREAEKQRLEAEQKSKDEELQILRERNKDLEFNAAIVKVRTPLGQNWAANVPNDTSKLDQELKNLYPDYDSAIFGLRGLTLRIMTLEAELEQERKTL